MIKYARYIITVLFSALNLFGFGQKAPIWVSLPAPGEYIGVSFPDGGEEQAVSIALFSYILGHEIDCLYTRKNSAQLFGNDSGQVERYQEFSRFVYTGNLKYDIVRRSILKSGESIVAITDGDTYKRRFAIIIHKEECLNNAKTKRKIEIGVGLSGKEWVLTIEENNELYPDVRFSSEEKMSPENIISVYPNDGKHYKYTFDGLTKAELRKITADSFSLGIHTNNQISLAGNIVCSLCDLLFYSFIDDLDVSCISEDENYWSSSTSKKRRATPIVGFNQKDESSFFIFIKDNL